MIKKIKIAVTALLLMGCTSNTILKKPKDLIGKEQMTDLLIDLYLAKSLELNEIPKLSGNPNWDAHRWVFRKHQIDTARFRTSNYYYTSVMDEYEDIFKAVLNRLKTMQKELKTKDSLARLKYRDSIQKLQIQDSINGSKTKEEQAAEIPFGEGVDELIGE